MMSNVKLIPSWRHFQVSIVSSSIHLGYELNDIEAVKKEAFKFDWLEDSSADVKQGKTRLKSCQPQENKDELSLLEMLSKVDYEAEKVRRRVRNYSPDHISILDKNIFAAELRIVNEENWAFQDWITSSASNIDECNLSESALEKLAEIWKVSDEINLLVENNAAEVKRKLGELLQEGKKKRIVGENVAEEKKRMAAQQQQKKKLLKMMEYVKHEADELRLMVSKVKDVNCMTDNEVQAALLESREWKFDMQALRKSLKDVDIDAVDIDVDEEDMEQFHEDVKLVIGFVNQKIDDLVQKDKELCLYTLTPQRKVKSVHYPEPFGGEAHENVFTFVEDMKKALDDDQIRTKSKVKVLLKYLKGNAKMRIAFAENVDEAFEILLTTFTTPDLLWEMKKEEITQAFGERNVWGPIESVQRRNTISKMISCLEEAKRLSSQHEDLKSLILSRTTYSFFYSLLPRTIKDDIISARSMNDTINEKFDILNKVLRAHLRYTVYGLDLSAGYNKVSQKFDTKSPPTEPKKVHVDSKSFTQHSCVKSPGCRAEWNKIGCIKLYHLKSVDERISFLKEMKCCVRCGRKFSKFHKCRKDRKLENAMCTKVECKLPSVLCNAHINDGNASPELRRWLSRNGIDPNVIFGTVKSEEMDDVCNRSDADVLTNTSVNMVNGNVKVRKICRPEHEWYHANYLTNNYRSHDILLATSL